MKTNFTLLLLNFIVIVTEIITPSYLLVEVDHGKDVGMFLLFLAKAELMNRNINLTRDKILASKLPVGISFISLKLVYGLPEISALVGITQNRTASSAVGLTSPLLQDTNVSVAMCLLGHATVEDRSVSLMMNWDVADAIKKNAVPEIVEHMNDPSYARCKE